MIELKRVRIVQGPLCTCPRGEVLNTTYECMDLNECDPPGLCSQHCTNTKGSYFCGCVPGYVLEPDKHTCKALSKASATQLLFKTIVGIGPRL